jgi:hypothetical protein
MWRRLFSCLLFLLCGGDSSSRVLRPSFALALRVHLAYAGKKCSKPRQLSSFRSAGSRGKRQEYFLVPAQAKCDGVMASVRATERQQSTDSGPSAERTHRRKQSGGIRPLQVSSSHSRSVTYVHPRSPPSSPHAMCALSTSPPASTSPVRAPTSPSERSRSPHRSLSPADTSPKGSAASTTSSHSYNHSHSHSHSSKISNRNSSNSSSSSTSHTAGPGSTTSPCQSLSPNVSATLNTAAQTHRPTIERCVNTS